MLTTTGAQIAADYGISVTGSIVQYAGTEMVNGRTPTERGTATAMMGGLIVPSLNLGVGTAINAAIGRNTLQPATQAFWESAALGSGVAPSTREVALSIIQGRLIANEVMAGGARSATNEIMNNLVQSGMQQR
jgi:hypothetical protein